jgi:hypothetical protein
MEILPLPITPCDLLAKFLLLVLLTMCSAGLEVLGFCCFFVFLFGYTRDWTQTFYNLTQALGPYILFVFQKRSHRFLRPALILCLLSNWDQGMCYHTQLCLLGISFSSLGFELRTSHLLGRHSTRWTMSPFLFVVVIFEVSIFAQASLDHDIPLLRFPLSLGWQL